MNYEVCAQVRQKECSDLAFPVGTIAVGTYMYFDQINVEHRFQEPQTLEKWAAGEHYTDLVDLTKIDRVPVSLVHAVADETCDSTMIEWTYA